MWYGVIRVIPLAPIYGASLDYTIQCATPDSFENFSLQGVTPGLEFRASTNRWPPDSNYSRSRFEQGRTALVPGALENQMRSPSNESTGIADIGPRPRWNRAMAMQVLVSTVLRLPESGIRGMQRTRRSRGIHGYLVAPESKRRYSCWSGYGLLSVEQFPSWCS